VHLYSVPQTTTTLSQACLCCSELWHSMVEGVVWCKRCGCMRPVKSRYWRVPLDRVNELSWATIVEGGDDDGEPDTLPGKKLPPDG
jgi:hypothetical protein